MIWLKAERIFWECVTMSTRAEPSQSLPEAQPVGALYWFIVGLHCFPIENVDRITSSQVLSPYIVAVDLFYINLL